MVHPEVARARALALMLLAAWAAWAARGAAGDTTRALFLTTKRGNKDRSTSSSSGERQGSNTDAKAESLEMSLSGSSSSGAGKKVNKYKPVSSVERHGWHKWHRKCTPCPGDMELKWRDPRIGWICGGYQRARRSFKSACMMRYRNCQDGTMFVELYPRRCANDSAREPLPHGEHFFYDYRVMLSADSSGSESSSAEVDSRSSSSGTVHSSKMRHRRHHNT